MAGEAKNKNRVKLLECIMGKFKDFILKEELGLAELGPKIHNLMHDQRFGNQVGAYLSTDMSGTEQSETLGYQGRGLHLPSTDLTVPSMERTGRIQILLSKKNPIFLQLSDGTQAFFTYDEYRKIQGEPSLGKTMTIIFQRHPDNNSTNLSKIEKAMVLE